jgi:LPXTG-site transpeptidase (sortase) family protein
MAELIRRRLKWASLSRLEQLALVSSVFIWVGVALSGGGLYLAMRNHNLEQQAFVQATSVATLTTEPPTRMPTTEVFPLGWATATPTATPTSTPVPTKAPKSTVRADVLHESTVSDPGKVSPATTPDIVLKPANVSKELATDFAFPPAPAPPDRIAIPSIKLDSPIVPIGWYVVEQDGQQFSVWQVADYAVSWHKTSAYPGHGGNVVLNGHHNIKGEVFRYLVDVDIGDRILLYAGEQVYFYAVEQKMILKEKGETSEVRRQNASWIAPTDDERLTMVTCWPYTNNTHRLVIVAKPAPPPPATGLEE